MKRPESKLNKKQQKYHRYVIDRLIENTFVDVRDQKIWHPYDSHYSRHLIGGAPGQFVDFVEDKFGILRGEVDWIWAQYKHQLKDENDWIQIDPYDDLGSIPLSTLYESISKNPKQQQLFDYVVKQMVDGTRIVPPGDGTLLLIIPDFINAENASPFLYGRYLKTQTFPIPTYVMLRYFKDTYGLVNDEIQLVWDRYREIMYRKLSKEYPNSFRDDPPVEEMFPHSINEARKHNKGSDEFKRIDNPKQHRLYNKIADKIVELTEVRDEQWGKNIFLTDLLDPAFPGQGMSLPPAINIPDYETFQKRMLTIVHDFFPMLEKYWYIDDIFSNVFILTRFVFPKLWNNFYKDEDQPEESTEYGEHALDYEEKMGKEKITRGSNTSWDDVTNNESIDNKLFNINESKEDNYVDKIVDQLIDETYIVKEKRTPRRGKSKWLYFVRNPFMDVTPNFTVFLYALIQMDPGEQFQKHCREIYGATPDQIKDIWSSYTYYLSEIKPEFDTDSDTLRKAIEPINESIEQDFFDSLKYQGDNKEELDRIVNNIVKGTIFHRKMERNIGVGGTDTGPSVELPELQQYMFTKNRFFIAFYVFNPTHELNMNPDFHHLLDSIKGMFSKHGKDIYGLTDEESKYVWDQYKSIISDKIKSDPSYEYNDPLNESTSKKQKFLDTVLRDMLNQSTIYRSQFDVDTVITPSGNEVFNFHLWVKILTPPNYLTNYMRDTYGLIDEEIYHVWLRYKDIMLDKIKKRDGENNPFRITESTKPLPDRIFQMIQDDLFNRTVKIPTTNRPLCTGGESVDYRDFDDPVDVGANQEGVYDQPNFVIQLNLPSSEFPYNVEMGRKRSWGQLNDYLTQQYGLTDEECKRVWDEYRGTICKNAKLPSLNESRDKQQELIQYVITTLLKETIIDKENSEVILPWNMKYVNIMANFAGIDKDLHNAALELNGSMAYNFWDMMESIYGLTDDEVERVWKIYGPTLSRKMHDVWFDDWKKMYFDEQPILDEAEAKIITHPEDDEDPYSFAWHPEPKKRKFYEVVLRDVVNNSTIEPDGVISVGDTEESHQRGLLFHNLSHAYDVGPFLKHLRDTYGLVRHETHPIWSRWEHIMGDKIKKWLTAKGIKLSDAGYEEPLWAQNDEEEINESKDKKKAKQQKVLDYAIEDLTNNTLVDWGYNEYHNEGHSYQIIRFPFSVYPHEDPTKNRLEWIMIDPHYNLDISEFYRQFKPYVKLMYGLTDIEIVNIFPDWEDNIIEKIRDHSETDPPRP